MATVVERVAHGSHALGDAGAREGITEGKVEDAARADDRHLGRSHGKTDAAALELARDARGRLESKGGSAGEHDGVHDIHGVLGAQQVGLARCRGAAAHVHPARGALGRDDDGAAGAGLLIGAVTDGEALDIG